MENLSTIATQSISKCLEQAWKNVTKNIWLFAGFTVLYFTVSSVVGLIPVIGSLSNFFSFIFSASIFAAASVSDQGAELGFNHFFSWSPKFGRLFLGNLVLMLLAIAILIPLALLLIALLGMSFFSSLASGGDPSDLLPFITMSNVLAIVGLVFVFVILLSIVFFAYPFIIQYTELSISDSLKYSFKIGRNNIGQIIIFAFLAMGLSILGLLFLGIGLAVAIPLIMLTQYYFLHNIIIADSAEKEWDFLNQQPE